MIINIDAATYAGRIQIGKQGENLTTSVVFDCNAWLDGLDGGSLSIVHQRNSDPDAYPCGNYSIDGKVLTWSINETDLAFCGLGQCELRYTIGERIAKSKTFVTQTIAALDPGETPPEAWEPYIDRVIDAAAQEMENMTVSASATSGEQTSVSVTKTRENDHEHIAFEFTVEKGDKGDKGDGMPNNPSSDGSYVMSCERTGGVSSISWSNHLSEIDKLLFVRKYLPFVQGGINNTGANANNTRQIRTNEYYKFKGDRIRITAKSVTGKAVYVRVYTYDAQKVYVTRKNFTGVVEDYPIRSDYCYRFMIFDNNEGASVDAELVDTYFELRVYDNLDVPYHRIAVKKNGKGDFTSLRSAVESISDASAENPYLIEIYPGIYNVMDDFTNEEILAYADDDVKFGGIIIGDGISLRGVGNNRDIVLNGYLPTTYDRTTIRNKVGTITVGGNASIENMTIIAENIRYCIHDAYNNHVGKYTRLIKDVVLIASNLTSGASAITYGCGFMDGGQDSLFENVDFGTDILMHSNLVADQPTVTIFHNCRGGKFVFDVYGNYAVKNTIYVEASPFECIKLQEADAVSEQNSFIMAEGNPDVLVSALPGRVVLTENISKVKKNNIPVGTAVKMNSYNAEATTNFDAAFGIIVNQDADFTYVQRRGYIFADYIGLTVSEGDYVTLDANGALTTTGATASNAVGVVIAYRNEMYIRMKR